MKKLKSFKDLVVWQLSSEFSKEMAQLVKIFPRHERYALADDLLRAARSIPANIAEGWGRVFPKEKVSFYNISNGSAEECANHLIETHNNGYIDKKTNELYQKKLHIISVKLTNLIMSTRKRIKPSAKRVFSQRRVFSPSRTDMSSALYAKACLQVVKIKLDFNPMHRVNKGEHEITMKVTKNQNVIPAQSANFQPMVLFQHLVLSSNPFGIKPWRF